MPNNSFQNKWSKQIESRSGYSQIPNMLLDYQAHLKITNSELSTLLHIVRFMDVNRNSTVSLKVIARANGSHHSTQSKNVKNLTKKKLIKRNYRYGSTTRYSLDLLVERLNFITTGSTQNRAPPLPKNDQKPYSKTSTNNKANNLKKGTAMDKSSKTESIDQIIGGKYEHLRR